MNFLSQEAGGLCSWTVWMAFPERKCCMHVSFPPRRSSSAHSGADSHLFPPPPLCSPYVPPTPCRGSQKRQAVARLSREGEGSRNHACPAATHPAEQPVLGSPAPRPSEEA